LRQYGSLEKALAAGCFPALAKTLRRIATTDKSAPLPVLRDQKPNWAKASALARDWQLNKLAERLEKLANVR
jgi:DNA polymerase-1